MTEYPTNEERIKARADGAACRASGGSSFDNPYHKNWPNPAKGGNKEEVMARLWIGGFLNQNDDMGSERDADREMLGGDADHFDGEIGNK